jgi:LysR family carnitine catabolism transcriptional activator
MAFKTAASNLSLRQLRAFLCVAEEASMTRAATRLHLTPSALSMLVRGMEDDLGFKLFERTTRRLVLTEAGQQLLPTVEQVFASLEHGIDAIRTAQQVKASQFSIATSPLLATALVPEVIASFRQQHPQVRVKLLDAAVESLPALVRDESADMAICTANSDFSDLRATKLYADKLMLVCSIGHPLSDRREVEWHELVDESLILLRPGSGLRALVDKALARWRKQKPPAYEVSQVATALGLIEAGEGVSILPSYAISRAQSSRQEQRLVSVALVSPVVRREIVALTRDAETVNAVGESFIAHFKKIAGNSASLGR